MGWDKVGGMRQGKAVQLHGNREEKRKKGAEVPKGSTTSRHNHHLRIMPLTHKTLENIYDSNHKTLSVFLVVFNS